jgi:hypothetical protein
MNLSLKISITISWINMIRKEERPILTGRKIKASQAVKDRTFRKALNSPKEVPIQKDDFQLIYLSQFSKYIITL